MDLTQIESWLSGKAPNGAGIEDLLEEITEAIRDYSRIFPAPYSLAPNLQLASRAAAVLTELRAERLAATEAVGLPGGASFDELIRHHRGSAAFATALDALGLAGDPELGLKDQLSLTDSEWRAFQSIPEQGYSHRAWVDARIRERVALALGEKALS